MDVEFLEVIPVEFLSKPSIHMVDQPQAINCATMADNWMTLIIHHVKDDTLLEDKNKAEMLKLKATCYILYDEKLYRRGFSTPLLKCVDLEEKNYML